MTSFVQLYKSTDKNAPALYGSAGSLIQLLNRCLVDGYGTAPVAVTSITRVSQTATLTLTTALPSLKVGDLITVAGAAASEYNGTFPIVAITSSTIITYTVTGSPATPAGGTITVHSLLPITSIERTSNTATVTLANADVNLRTGQWMTISGAGEADYNGTFQITVTDSTHFTYAVANSPTTPASGTPLYRKAPLGWERPFSGGTNSQSYRSADTDSNRLYLQIIDNAATAGGGKEAQAYGSEKLTSDNVTDTGNGYLQFPAVGTYASGLSWYKSTTADNANARPWTLVGNGKTFYLFIDANGAGANRLAYGFGHFISFKPADGYNTFISGSATFNTAANCGPIAVRQLPTGGVTGSNNPTAYALTAAVAGGFVARSYTQIGAAVALNSIVLGSPTASLYTGQINMSPFAGVPMGYCNMLSYPNVTDSGFYAAPIALYEPAVAAGWRGRLPGLYCPLHNLGVGTFALYDTFTSVSGLDGVTLTHQFVSAGCVEIDTFGPWS